MASQMIDLTNKTVYLSGGITGVDDYIGAFAAAKKIVAAAGARVVINPAELPSGWDWDHYIAACLGVLRCADCVVMLPGWQASRGAVIEIKHAMRRGIKCYELEEVANG
jgi:hypothetical protein